MKSQVLGQCLYTIGAFRVNQQLIELVEWALQDRTSLHLLLECR